MTYADYKKKIGIVDRPAAKKPEGKAEPVKSEVKESGNPNPGQQGNQNQQSAGAENPNQGAPQGNGSANPNQGNPPDNQGQGNPEQGQQGNQKDKDPSKKR